MRLSVFAAAVSLIGAGSAFAEGHADVAAGEDSFSQCQTCRVVVDGDGNTIAGRNAKTGPNLYGVVGRQAGTIEGFRYGKDIVEAGEAGLVWDEENFVAYVQDPTAFLREFLDNRRARGKMTYKVRADGDIAAEQVSANLYAYLASVSPEAEATN